jgi:hypothetical protein
MATASGGTTIADTIAGGTIAGVATMVGAATTAGARVKAGGDRGRWNNGGGWNSDWRRDRRYDWRGYRAENRSIFRSRPYYAPYRGYSYSRLRVGFFLDSVFFGNQYWINDPWSYRLPDVYGPYRWVRYYNDVLLVDVYSGEVVDVIYDFFW